MLDMKFIREHADEVKQNLVNRHNPFDLDEVLALDGKRRELLRDTETAEEAKRMQNPRRSRWRRRMAKMRQTLSLA